MPEPMLRSESARPLYNQLMERLQLEIRNGVYPAGEKIPTEHELETRYGVSRVTVRRALSELTAAGMLERKQGKGTFVAYPKPRAEERSVQGFHDACREMGRKPGVAYVKVEEVKGTREDCAWLGLEPDANVLKIQRVLTADGEPVILETARFTTAYSWLQNANLKGSLYRSLQEYGIQAEKSIYDLSLRRITAKEADLLQAEEGTAVIAVKQVVYDQRGRPLHISDRLIRGEKYTLRI